MPLLPCVTKNDTPAQGILYAAPVRCACGAYIHAQQKRCRPCAVSFARGIDTDRFDIITHEAAEEVESIMTRKPSETTKKFNPNKFQHIGTVRQINQAVQDHRGRMFWRRFILGFAIVVIIVALAFWACWR